MLAFEVGSCGHSSYIHFVAFLFFVETGEMLSVKVYRWPCEQYLFSQSHVIQFVEQLVGRLQDLKLQVLEPRDSVLCEDEFLVDVFGPPPFAAGLLHLGPQQFRHYFSLLLLQDGVLSRFGRFGFDYLSAILLPSLNGELILAAIAITTQD